MNDSKSEVDLQKQSKINKTDDTPNQGTENGMIKTDNNNTELTSNNSDF